MSFAAVAAAGIGLVSSQMSKGDSSSSTKQEMDPRMAPYIFGTPGTTGPDGNTLVPGTKGLLDYGQDQLLRSRSPAQMQGWQNMQNRGQQLMGGSIAGNPFSAGYQGGGNPGLFSGVRNGVGNGIPQFNPAQMQQPMQQPAQDTTKPLTLDDIMAEIDRRKQNQPYDDYGMGIG